MDAKQAALRARDYLVSLIPEADAILLEEVEKDGNNWLITLSMYRHSYSASPFGEPPRTYKTFEVNALTGEVLAMRMRAVS